MNNKQQIEYGYARKGSKDKEAEIQLAALREAGVLPENLFVDQPSEKEMFRYLMGRIQPGNVLVIKSLRQLGYSYREILSEWELITGTLGVHIRVLDSPLLDTRIKVKGNADSFVSDLFLQIASFAMQQEQAHIKHRQAEGIAYAKLQGKHLGRPRIPKPLKFDDMYDRWRAGEISAEEAMTTLNLKRSTFERFVKERKEELKRELEQKAS